MSHLLAKYQVCLNLPSPTSLVWLIPDGLSLRFLPQGLCWALGLHGVSLLCAHPGLPVEWPWTLGLVLLIECLSFHWTVISRRGSHHGLLSFVYLFSAIVCPLSQAVLSTQYVLNVQLLNDL